MDKNKGKVGNQSNHPKTKKNHDPKTTDPKKIRGPIPSPRQSQTVKNENEIKSLVKKFDKDSIQGTNSTLNYKSSRIKMKNLGIRYFTQLNKNTQEKKRMQSEPQNKDLNLIKEQVSVRQIKQTFIQNSLSSNMFGSQKSLIRQKKYLKRQHKSTESTKNFTNTTSLFLIELLESAKKRNSTHGNTVNSCLLTQNPDTMYTEQVKLSQHSKQDEMTLEQNKSTSLMSMAQTTITAFHLQTNDHVVISKQTVKEIENEEAGENVFQPQSYSFRLTSNTPMTNCPVKARPPPFWALLDNFIAVIWGLLNHDRIGIHQLQWTYELLKVMKYKNGLFPEIVEEYLEKIQDELIFIYAEFYEMKEKNKNKNSSEVLSARKEEQLNVIARTIAKKNKWVDRKALMKSFSLKEIIKQGTNSICKPTEADKLIIKSLIPKAAQENRTKQNVPQRHTECDANMFHINEKQKEGFKDLLYRMRKEQTEKIQNELAKIQKIENFMSQVDVNFIPSLDYQSAQVVSNNMKY